MWFARRRSRRSASTSLTYHFSCYSSPFSVGTPARRLTSSSGGGWLRFFATQSSVQRAQAFQARDAGRSAPVRTAPTSFGGNRQRHEGGESPNCDGIPVA